MAAGIAEGRRVLVVEDEFTIVLLIEELLDLGIQVIGPASRLDAALRLAREAQIDAAMLDINILGGTPTPSPIFWLNGGSRSSSAPTTAIGPWRSATAIVRV
jgi:hypothetical protein